MPFLKLGRLVAVRRPREAEASGSVWHHVALHQQLVVWIITGNPLKMGFFREWLFINEAQEFYLE